MNVKKLKSADVGTHHPEQAVIFTDKGELFVTRDELTADGYELVRFQTYDLDELTTIVNNVLKGNPVASVASVQIEAQTILVSSIANLFKITGYLSGAVLDTIIGGREAQTITLTGDGTPLTITTTGNLKLTGDMTLSSPYSILMLQKAGNTWIELSRRHNN